ncbi:hypothetical protein [Moraxella catarrhalis]
MFHDVIFTVKLPDFFANSDLCTDTCFGKKAVIPAPPARSFSANVP